MEKPWKIKGRILALLPKAATSAVTFQLSPPLSPVKAGAKKIPIIPKEARRKPKNSSFEQKEPASPKVSCMGKVKKNNCNLKLVAQPPLPAKEEEKKKVSIMKIFKGGKKVDVADDVHNNKPGPGVVVQRVASSSHVKKYASGRGGALEDFDWRICEEEQEDEENGKVIIPYEGDIEPRKEVNLWKRRNKEPPIPLEI